MTDLSIKILFVCLGNICRSPAAEGVLKTLTQKHPNLHLIIASCGIGDWHLGHLPDKRMRKACEQRGVLLTSRAQQFKIDFFEQFDYILASDLEVAKKLHEYAKTLKEHEKIQLMTAYSSKYFLQEVPDPYLMDLNAFDDVLDILDESCQGIIDHLIQNQPSE